MTDLATRPKSEPKNAGRRNDRGRLRIRHVVFLLVLLVAPVLALHRLSAFIPFPWLVGYAVIISLVTYAVYGADKDSAEDKASRWRAPEKLLHGLEIAGGWPGAFLAQRRLRHKCSKLSYQIVFWLIVSAHVYVATDYQLDWRMTRGLSHHTFHSGSSPAGP